jgi:hypothetical protein
MNINGQEFEDFMKEAEIIANYLRQQILNGTISQELYKRNVLRFIDAYEIW